MPWASTLATVRGGVGVVLLGSRLAAVVSANPAVVPRPEGKRMRKLVSYAASTIDGFVAGPDGSVEHFPVEQDLLDFIGEEYPETLPTHVRAALGLDLPNRRFDTVVMGRGTYEPALEVGITSPYAHLRQYVFSRSLVATPGSGVEIVSGTPRGSSAASGGRWAATSGSAAATWSARCSPRSTSLW
jgi:hypothetical protein